MNCATCKIHHMTSQDANFIVALDSAGASARVLSSVLDIVYGWDMGTYPAERGLLTAVLQLARAKADKMPPEAEKMPPAKKRYFSFNEWERVIEIAGEQDRPMFALSRLQDFNKTKYDELSLQIERLKKEQRVFVGNENL